MAARAAQCGVMSSRRALRREIPDPSSFQTRNFAKKVHFAIFDLVIQLNDKSELVLDISSLLVRMMLVVRGPAAAAAAHASPVRRAGPLEHGSRPTGDGCHGNRDLGGRRGF